MPRIRPGMPRPPKGFDKISAGLDDFDAAMRDAMAAPTDTRDQSRQMSWGVAAVNAKRTRYVFDALRRGDIDQAVVDFCVKCSFIDGTLVKLWRVAGYETACCANCVDSRQSTFGGACVCRVPAKDRVAAAGPCKRCGCTGCAAGDVGAAKSAAARRNDDRGDDDDDGSDDGGKNENGQNQEMTSSNQAEAGGGAVAGGGEERTE